MEPTSYLSLMKFKFDHQFLFTDQKINIRNNLTFHIFHQKLLEIWFFTKFLRWAARTYFLLHSPCDLKFNSFRPLTNDLNTSEAISLTGNQLCTFSLWISLQISPWSLHSPAFRARQPAVDPPGSLPWPGRRPAHPGSSTGFACTLSTSVSHSIVHLYSPVGWRQAAVSPPRSLI